MSALARDTAIVGIGQTEFSKHSGRSELQLAGEAVAAAVADAGLSPADIDGAVTFAIDVNDELSVIREQLLQRLIELGGEVVGATERFRGYAPGSAPVATPTVALYDAEADGETDVEVDEAATVSDS